MTIDVAGIVEIFVLVLMIVALVLILRVLLVMERTLSRPHGEGTLRFSKQS